MYSDIYRRFCAAVSQKCGVISKDTKILAAVSGGSDSVCLLMLLCDRFGADRIVCAHFNHMIRGEEACRDEDFTRSIALRCGVRFISGRGDVNAYARENRLGTEEAARKLRYAFLKESASEIGEGTLIATGHNSGDRTETVLFNIARGTSIDGLKGMEYRTKDGIIRPLLDITKKETEEVCAHFDIKPVYDSTNSDTSYTRNMIRHDCLPYLCGMFGDDFESHIINLADNAAADSDFLNKKREEAFEECCIVQERPFRRIVLDTDRFSRLHISIKRRLARFIMSRVRDGSGDYIFPDGTGIYSHMINSVCDMASSVRTGKRLDLPLGVKCIAGSDGLTFIHEECLVSGQKRIFESTHMSVRHERYDFGAIYGSLRDKKDSEEFFDEDKLAAEFGSDYKIEFRAGTGEDHFTPFGAPGGKKLSKFYIDKKISRFERPYIRVAAINNEILWIPGMRRSSAAPIDKNTTRVIILQCMSDTEGN